MAVREYFDYIAALGAMDARYDDCPFECQSSARRWDPHRTALCEGCMRARLKTAYRRAVERTLDKTLSGLDKMPRFDDLHSAIQTAAGCEGLPQGEVSARAGFLLGVYVGERGKRDGRN